jgi:plastocyanin
MMAWSNLAIGLALGAPAWCATVSGVIQLVDSKEAAVTRQKDNSGVVVWLEPLAAKPEAGPAGTASIAHKGKRFVPHVVAVRTGARVTFPNLDPFFHNAFSNYDGQMFDVGLHPPGSTRQVTFHRPGIVRMFCNIHPMMSALIVVLDTPWFSLSDAQGEFAMAGVPPGDYRLKFFHERALPETLQKLERKVTVAPEDLGLGAIALSEEGYLPAPHKNKYRKDYPAVIKDTYPGPAR